MIYEEVLLYHFPDFKKGYLAKVSKGESITNHIYKNENSTVVFIIKYISIYQFSYKKHDVTDDYDEYASSEEDI